MRMWGVDPATLCRQHLLGEHLELHMFVGAMHKGTSMQGFIDNGLLDVSCLESRHDELVAEMSRRGMKHKSPLKFVPANRWAIKPIDTAANLIELARRCDYCKRLQSEVCLHSD